MTIVDRKTSGVINAGTITVNSKRIFDNEGLTDNDYAQTKNILHRFRTFNYLFTLAACPDSALNNPAELRTSADYIVIARSRGKEQTGLPAGNSEISEVIEGYNQQSAGRYDMFIDNVEIETIMGFSQGTNLTMATKINFEIFEPYSMNGFIEALQVSAGAAGHKQYLAAPFLLKIEFQGYREDDKDYILGKEGTRIFVINITGVEIDVNETGSKYRCQAVSVNDMAFGDHLALKTSIQMSGDTVEKVLKSLMEGIEQNNKDAAENDKKNGLYDKFKIVFPEKTDSGYNFSGKNKIADAKITKLKEDKNAYVFPDHKVLEANINQKKNTLKDSNSSKTEVLVQFPAQAKIHDIISAVIRDSSFGKDILENISKSEKIPDFIEYAHVGVKMVPLEFDKKENRQTYEYTFIVFPYNMHYTRVPLFQHIPVDRAKLEQRFVRRKYNYLFTGQNVDIRSFNLKFNRLYFQAYPQGFEKIFENEPGSNRSGSPSEKESLEKDLNAPIYVDPNLSNVVPTGGNAGARNYDAYDKMVKAMHDAVLDNLDMITCEIEILGDPYYLVTQGSGNFFPEFGDSAGITADAEANYFSEDVIVTIEFRNPDDVNHNETGYMKFNDRKIPFSGCFRVIKAMSNFKDGLFTQRLNLIRVPGQPVNQGAQTSSSGSSQQGKGIDWTNVESWT